jgi:hypothetical protein
MTERELLLNQLSAIRDLLDNALALLGAEATVAADGVTCLHPDEQRTPAGTMGAPDQFFCRVCHTLVQPGAEVPA